MPQKPFFRKHDSWWVVQLRQGRKRWQHKLVHATPPKGKDTEAEAYRLFNELMAQSVDSLPPPSKLRIHNLLAAFLKYSAQHNDEKTFEWYQMYLDDFDVLYGKLRPHEVTPEVVDAWLKTHEKAQKATKTRKARSGWKGSRRCAVVALKRAFNWAFDNNKISRNPMKNVKKPPSRARERYLTIEERQKIFDNYPEGDCFRDFLFAMENTACRPGEVASVTAAQVNLHAGVWQFEEHKTDEKTGENRTIILTPEMVSSQ